MIQLLIDAIFIGGIHHSLAEHKRFAHQMFGVGLILRPGATARRLHAVPGKASPSDAGRIKFLVH
jgi:hypothetical protein